MRRRGYSSADAQDLTQGFFAQLLTRNYLAAVDREKGKFRSFLLASLKHYLANEWDRARAQKRGGDQVIVSIDEQQAEQKYRFEPSHDETPEKLYERRWALALLDQVVARLKDEYVGAGKKKLFERLIGYLMGDAGATPYAQAAAELGMSEGAVRVAVHRLRTRYREVLRAEIAETVSSPADMEEEIRQLFSALSD